MNAATINLPHGLHPDTADLVVRFAEALAAKLRNAEQKYGYSDRWTEDDWKAECATKLLEHVEKGDPRDVAAYCAFMWHHGWRTSQPDVYLTSGSGEAATWQPIESAPESTPILTYAKWAEPDQFGVSLFRHIEVVREELESESHNSKGRRRIIQERTERVREWSGAHWEPTHWMPIAAAPQEPHK